MRKSIIAIAICLMAQASWSQTEDAMLTATSPTSNSYLFDVSLKADSDLLNEDMDVTGARIEVYNNTTDETVIFIENHPQSDFQVNLEKGNHYSVLVRKEGFFNKRMEAYVDIKDCILCFDGVGKVEPNVTDAMNSDHSSGALLAEINMEKIEMNKIITMENIYYDYDSWEIRRDAAMELDKVIKVLNDHPSIEMEIGSHTCAKGNDQYNLNLSDKRAKAAVDYIIASGVLPNRVSSKGYGEQNPTNQCSNGVQCSERMHEKNRRTELKITGITEVGAANYKPLADIVMSERQGNNSGMSRSN